MSTLLAQQELFSMPRTRREAECLLDNMKFGHGKYKVWRIEDDRFLVTSPDILHAGRHKAATILIYYSESEIRLQQIPGWPVE